MNLATSDPFLPDILELWMEPGLITLRIWGANAVFEKFVQSPVRSLLWPICCWFSFTPAGVSPLAAAQDKGVACSTGTPLEGHHLRLEVGWAELWDQCINNLRNQGSQTRIQYLVKGKSKNNEIEGGYHYCYSFKLSYVHWAFIHWYCHQLAIYTSFHLCFTNVN